MFWYFQLKRFIGVQDELNNFVPNTQINIDIHVNQINRTTTLYGVIYLRVHESHELSYNYHK